MAEEIKSRNYTELVLVKGEEIFIVRYKPTAKYKKLTRMKLMEWVYNPKIDFSLDDALILSTTMVYTKRRKTKDISSRL